jgi:hypothetical protein
MFIEILLASPFALMFEECRHYGSSFPIMGPAAELFLSERRNRPGFPVPLNQQAISVPSASRAPFSSRIMPSRTTP